MSKYVIIGNSAAAIGCVEGIRKYDDKNEITIISDEKYHTYSRPLISYLLQGKTDLERMKYRPDDFYIKNNCKVMLGEKVVKIDYKTKKLALESGKSVDFEKLLISTGSSPFVPPFEGLDKVANKHTFAKLSDALDIEKSINSDSKVLIVGAGLIGLKCAECLNDKVKSITIVDLAPKVLSSILDEDASSIVKAHLEKNSVSLFLGSSVEKFESNKAYLSNKEVVDFDLLVLAVGVRPNVSLAKEMGCTVDRGITVDEKSHTSLNDIYAAGDCSQTIDFSSGASKIMAILPNAYMQGQTAGINMTGNTAEFKNAIPMNSIGIFNLHMTTAGNYTGDVYEENSNGNYKKLFYSNNKLNGYIMLGDIRNSGIYTSLIREATPLDSIDFDLVCRQPSLMAFSRTTRDKVLGGVK